MKLTRCLLKLRECEDRKLDQRHLFRFLLTRIGLGVESVPKASQIPMIEIKIGTIILIVCPFLFIDFIKYRNP
jgi:hypothetical protein